MNGVYQTPAGRFPRGHLNGLVASNAADTANDVTIGTGECRDSTNVEDMVLASAITKRIDAAWTVGNNVGGMDTGSVAANFYHMWLIKRIDTGVVDALFSLSATAPTMPANYTIKRRICSFYRGASIVNWFQQGDEFWLNTPILDVNGGTVGTSATLLSLSTPGGGVRTTAMFSAWVNKSPAASFNFLFSCPDCADTDPTAVYDLSVPSPTTYGEGTYQIRTNTSGQVRGRSTVAGCLVYITTKGFIDTRGRFD